jgi:2-oxoglutarate dehydrogenase E1 component
MPGANVSDAYNRELLEQQYSLWQNDPHAVDSSLDAFFQGLEFAGHSPVSSGPETPQATLPQDVRLQVAAVRLITTYRDLGHLMAETDPLADGPMPELPWALSMDRFAVSENDLNGMVDTSMFFGMAGRETLGYVLQALRETYCRSIGVEYMHMQSFEQRKWLASRMEPTRNRPNVTRSKQFRTLMTLHWAEMFEQFLHRKYVGQKRFSLEGGETLLPILDAIVERSPSLGIKEIVIGMAHRGRLNVLANLLQKPFEEIFNEFEDMYLPESTRDGDGDVKYHMGFSADIKTTDGGSVHLSLAANPSHLEAVNPVVEGRVRAKQRKHGDTERFSGVPLIIHGDAAMAGQGIVMETMNLANLHGYRTGGTVHVVVNNQIGFTTQPRDARSTQYCSDVAKFIQAPVFHVNGEDPEACVYAAQLALEFRQEFKTDVVIDMLCYRKYGHNEGDEPSFTQPVMYKKIMAKIGIAKTYTKQLVERGDMKQEEADAIDASFSARLEAALKEVKSSPPRKKGMKGYSGTWTGLSNEYSHLPVSTSVRGEVLDRIAERIVTVPAGFEMHPKLKGILGARRDNVVGRKSIDWGTAEALAYGSLVLEGYPVRLSGQDSRRGTFSHRHAYLYDYNNGRSFCPLTQLDPQQAVFDVYDSCLSETGVLGFEYGYSLDAPDSLCMWEAQFGDFANGAQVIIDQFIASGESKWNRGSGIVLLLPHGHEGQGPEHTSARLERFLQLCAEDNMQVCNFTTPAQCFHAFRRQVKRPFRKPMIVMTPKSLLRTSLSPMEDFITGQFHEVIDDTTVKPHEVKRVLICSGKVYFDLLAKRDEAKRNDVAIVRLEQIYPWPEQQLKAVLGKYPQAERVWVQEESQNNGAWFFVEPRLRDMGFDAKYCSRDASSSPATGSHHVHKIEQDSLVDAALNEKMPYLVVAAKKGK